MRKGCLIFLLFLMIFLTACSKESPLMQNSLNWEVQDFEFVNQDEQMISLEDLKGQVWLADFIFTNCNTVCPPMTYNMSQIQERLVAEKLNIPIVSFSVDPEVDTPERLKEYAQNFNADHSTWNFLTGYSQEHIEKFAQESFKTVVFKPENTDQVTHGTSFYLIDPSGKVVTRYDGYVDTPFEEIINDIKTLKSSKKEEDMEMDHSHMSDDPSLDAVEVEVILESNVKVNQPTTIKTRITQGEEAVDDADEVIFEIWLDGHDDHEKIDGVPQGDGIYSIEVTFDQPGSYHLIPHVTARQVHVMPKEQFEVGEH